MTTGMFEDATLIEGGPIPPKPTLSYWSLPDSVSTLKISRI